MPKALLAVIDGCKPSMLERAVERGEAPVIAAVLERGTFVPELCAAFPSVTPVCATSIATGVLQDRHHIAAMNWWSRAERRYVEYGSSFRAARKLGIARQLTDTVYNLNGSHLATDVDTVYESLDDAGVRTAGTTYLVYRGRHEHSVSRETALTRLAGQLFRKPVMGPRELFYADIFSSRDTGCRGQMGLPGVRDQHSGCVASWLAARDLYDFLLLSLPDNDTHSHKYGPFAQIDSLAAADRQLARMMEPAGGIDAFLEDHAVIVCSDHSQSKVEQEIDLFKAFDGFGVRAAQRSKPGDEIAVCPNSRAAQVYVLDRDQRRKLVPRIERTLLALDGVDLVMRMGDHPDGEAVVRGERSRGVKEVRFAPRGDLVDARGEHWSVDGDLDLLGLTIEDDRVRSATYPDALSRVWSALRCRTSGEVLASARPGYEFRDWGGAHHVGGGSHGSLHANDSLGSLLWCGTGPAADSKEQWALRDITPMILQHFGEASP
jgi:hypothetical protein